MNRADEVKAQTEQANAKKQQRALREMVRAFIGIIEASGRRIAAEAPDIATKRRSVLWRMRAADAIRDVLSIDQPALGVLDLWTLCVQVDVYFATGDGSTAFGPQQAIANEATDELVRSVEYNLKELLDPKRLDEARKEVYEFAKKHPITGSFARLSVQPSDAPSEDKKGMFSWMPSLNPLGGVNKGIGEGAEAIQSFARVADKFNDIVDFLPQRLSWRLELLQYDLAESKLVSDANKHLAEVNATVNEMVKTTRDLPANVRTELVKALSDVDPDLKEVRAVLTEVKEASASLDKTGETYGKTAISIEAMSQQLDKALGTFEKVLIQMLGDRNKPQPPEQPDPNKRPFDILDYAKTAESIAAAAGQLNTTLAEFKELVADDRLTKRVEDAGNEAEKTVSTMIWVGSMGLVAAFAAMLVLLFVYHLLTRRVRRVQAAGSPSV